MATPTPQDVRSIFAHSAVSSPFSKSLVSALPKQAAQASPLQKVAQAQAGKPQGGRVDTSQKGAANFEGTQVAGWIAPILQYARQHGWKGSLNSGLRSFADQTRIWNSGVRPAARPGTSNHEMTAYPGGAIDVNGAEQLHAILQKSPYSGVLVWAGAKDPVHFSHPHNGSY